MSTDAENVRFGKSAFGITPDGFEVHDPIQCRCELCKQALRRSLNQLADLDLGPKDADELIRRLRHIAAGNLRVVA